ncbi:aromatic prenyltransferase [Streptomyces capparidis]
MYSAVEESTRLLDIACSRDEVQPVVNVYRDALPEAVIVFSVATDERHAGELDYTITVPAGGDDPYALALSNGLVAETDHPVGALLSDVQERCAIGGYAVDCGVVGGFKKIYTFFPHDDLQVLSKLADIPSMPRSVAENVGLFARHGLDDRVTMLGIDYQQRTVNVYFGKLPAECLEPKAILSMLDEIGLPEPNEQMLAFARKSFAIYATLNWDSAKVERICFAVPPGRDLITLDPSALPAPIEPRVEKFARNAPYAYSGERMLVYGVTWSPDGEYYKIGSYYQLPPQTRKLLVAFDDVEEL